MAPILHHHLKPPLNVARSWYRSMFSIARSGPDTNMLVNAVDVNNEEAGQMSEGEDYHGTHDAIGQTGHADGPIPEVRRGMSSYSRSYTIEPSEPFTV